jgi:hypothetical protein
LLGNRVGVVGAVFLNGFFSFSFVRSVETLADVSLRLTVSD